MKMKKWAAPLVGLAMLLTLTACGGPAEQEPASSQTPSVASELAQTSSAQSQSPLETIVPQQEETTQSQAAITQTQPQEGETAMQITVQSNGNSIVFQLNDSQAARDLYNQLPLTIEVENYSTNEKIFYPPQTLDVSDAPRANAGVGTLAYYAPWGDVVMFYGDFGAAGGLYELGQAVSGSQQISSLSGTVEVAPLES